MKVRQFFKSYYTSVLLWIIFTFQGSTDRWILVGKLKIPRAYYKKCVQPKLHTPKNATPIVAKQSLNRKENLMLPKWNCVFTVIHFG